MLTTTPNLIRRWTLGSTGTGTVNLTPCGWRASKITGLHRVELPLKAVAMVLDDGENRIGIVAADTIGLMRSFVQDLRSNVPDELALDYVMVHATHNHEGPDTQGLWGEGAVIRHRR